MAALFSDDGNEPLLIDALKSAATNGESSSANFWITQEGTGSSSQDLPAALRMRRNVMEGSMVSNGTKLEMHGGLTKTGGAADAVDGRTPASFSAKAWPWRILRRTTVLLERACRESTNVVSHNS